MDQTDELTERDERAEREATCFRVLVVAGPEKGREVLVHATSPGPIRVGVSDRCDLVLTDRKVSRRHLSLTCERGHLRVSDLGSTNGTKVNLVAVERALLRGGEIIHVGDSALRVEVSPEGRRPDLSARQNLGRIVGASRAMRRLYPVFESLAAADVPVIIEGEPGTGKELLAETLHEMGRRKEGPFVTFEVKGEAQALERVLFGSEGGGEPPSPGMLEEASGGTLFIRDVAELPLPLQSRLVRAIERRESTRVGGSAARPLDVRLIVATIRNLDRDVENGKFREDLFTLVSARRVELPPLRHREGDARLLTTTFWQRMDRTGRPVPPDLLAHVGNAFRGNVEELERAVSERLAADAPQLDIGAAAVPPIFENVLAHNLSWGEARQRVLAEFERIFLLRMLEQHGGNVTRAAEAAGIARRHFHRLKARHGRSPT